MASSLSPSHTPSPTKSSRASLWLTIVWMLSGLNSCNIGTITARYVTVARNVTAQAAQLRLLTAILSPGLMPHSSKMMWYFSILRAKSLYCSVAPR